MRRTLCLIALLGLMLSAALPGSLRAQEAASPDYATAFRVYTAQGEAASLDDILAAMDQADAVLVGETHTDPVAHWIEAELFRQAVERFNAGGAPGQTPGALRPVALSLEMFEQDVQYILDEYLAGLITERQFLSSARPWEYYEEDYRPMVELAKERGLPVIAANAPRRYVNRVSRLGRDALWELPASTRRFLPPLPFPAPTDAYRSEWTELMSNMTMEDQCPAPETPHPSMPDSVAGPPPMVHPAQPDTGAAGHPMMMPPPSKEAPSGEEAPPHAMPAHAMGDFLENGLQAQTLWDASMGYAMATYLEMHPGALVLHMVGGFHVENHTGTPEKLSFYRPETRILVVATEPVEDINAFHPEDHGGLGDFVILTDDALNLYVPRNCGTEEGEG